MKAKRSSAIFFSHPYAPSSQPIFGQLYSLMTTITEGFVSEEEEGYPKRCRTCRWWDPVPTFLRPLPSTLSLATSTDSSLKTPFKRVSTLKKSQREKILEGWGGAAQVMCTLCSFLTPSSPFSSPRPPPPIFGQHHVLEGQLQSSSTIPNSLPVETNATPILAQSPIHRLAFARPVADKMQLTFPNSLSPSALLLMQPGQPNTQSPQFKANIPLGQ